MTNTPPGKRSVQRGEVVSNKMQNTIVVRTTHTYSHPKYGKVMSRAKKLYAHTTAAHQIGDMVTLMETRPLSKLKRWIVVEEAAQ